MSAGDMAAIMAVFEFPPKFSRNNHVNTESRYGIKSAFFDFLFFDAYISGEKKIKSNILTSKKYPRKLNYILTDYINENFFLSGNAYNMNDE